MASPVAIAAEMAALARGAAFAEETRPGKMRVFQVRGSAASFISDCNLPDFIVLWGIWLLRDVTSWLETAPTSPV